MLNDNILFSDKDYIYYLLIALKETEKQCLNMIKTNNKCLYNVYRDLLLEIAVLERRVYYILFINGWYLLDSVGVRQLQERYHVFYEQYNKDLI